MSTPKNPSAKPAHTPLTYADAGVSIEAGDRLVDQIKPLAKSTVRPGAEGDLGGFGGVFDLKAAGFKDPVLVSGTDGVGTKLRIAIDTDELDTVGIDLVAMCVNDVLSQGAEPLFFLDYYATGHLDPEKAAAVISGIAEGCRQSGCALIGGETAEMPGMYEGQDFDLAGFVVGATERGSLLPQLSKMQPGDTLIGIPSSGPHSNGYSLVRKIVDLAGLGWGEPAPFAPEQTLAQALLTPTRIYVRAVLPTVRRGLIKGIAHITGGGLSENIPRMLPENLSFDLNMNAWKRPPVFRWLQSMGNISEAEMQRAFNCGIGLVLCVAASDVASVLENLKAEGEEAVVIGTVVSA